MFKALLALAASSALTVGLIAPAEAAGPPFADRVRAAVAAADPTLQPSEEATLKGASLLDSGQTVEVDQATFRASGKVVSVLRSVGAVPVVKGTTAVGRVLQKRKVKRARAGTREVIFSTTADQYGPGLLIAAWTERTGVNYRVVSRDGLDRAGLLKVVKALPADGTQASRKAKRAIESKRPSRKPSEPLRSASSLYVDGAGGANDDWADEGTLCNGCSYSSSNYAYMWQRVLWADGFLSQSSIDCIFGSQTASATVSWQSWRGVSADGIVGVNTRGKADNYLVETESTAVYYEGRYYNVSFNRVATNNRYTYGGKYLGYTYVSIC